MTPIELVRAAPDGAVALERLVVADRALALRAAIAITRRALAVAAPRPHLFVDGEAEGLWSDDEARVVDEVLAAVEELAQGRDAARERGAELLRRAGALQDKIAAAADAYDYDQGSLVMIVVCALATAALDSSAIGGVAHAAAWLVPCTGEESLAHEPSTWDRRRALRLVALREPIAEIVLDA